MKKFYHIKNIIEQNLFWLYLKTILKLIRLHYLLGFISKNQVFTLKSLNLPEIKFLVEMLKYPNSDNGLCKNLKYKGLFAGKLQMIDIENKKNRFYNLKVF